MKQELQRMLEKEYKKVKGKRGVRKIVTFLAAIVVFCTTYALVLPAITLETTCGYEEHTHEAACYENENSEGLLLCVLEGHIHTDICYEKIETIAEEAAVEDTANETPEETLQPDTTSEGVLPEESVESVPVDETSAEKNDAEQEGTASQTKDVTENIGEVNEFETEITTETEVTDTDEIIIENDTAENEQANAVEMEDAEDSTSVFAENDKEEESAITMESRLSSSEEVMLFGLITTEDGTEITWELQPSASGSYTLVVSGDGAIPDNFVENVPELVEEFANSSIDKLLIGKGITSIGQYAFANQTSLESVDFEDGSALETIRGAAFAECSNLSYVSLEKCTNLKTIEDTAKANAGLHGAFAGTSLLGIQLPENMDYIGTYAFYNCKNIKELNISKIREVNNSFVNFNGLKKLTITDVETFRGFANLSSLTDVTITNVDKIGNYAFGGCQNLNNLNLTNVKEIIGTAFTGCTALTRVDLTGVETVWDKAFQGCTSLIEVNLQDVKVLRSLAFSNCTNLLILENCNLLETIGSYAFSNAFSNLKKFEYTKENFPVLKSFNGKGSFGNTGIEELTIGAGVPLGNELFQNSNSLKKVTFETNWATNLLDIFAGTTSKFDSIIATEVDEFYGENLQTIAAYTSSLYFEGPNYLTITAVDGGNGFPKPLGSLGGNYYVDESGVLYLLNDTDGTATLAYCPPNLKIYTVPGAIPKADNSGSYTVTAVGTNAFALASDLASLNEKTTKEEAALAVNTVLALEGEAALKAENLTNTNLNGGFEEGGEGDEDTDTDNPGDTDDSYDLPTGGTATKETIKYEAKIGENTFDDILLIKTDPVSQRPQTDGSNIFNYYTGEYNNTQVGVSPHDADISGKVLRIYISSSDPEIEFELATGADGESYTIQGKTFIRKSLGNGMYYIDLPLLEGSDTIWYSLNFTYPSPETPGGTVYLWGAILDNAAAQEESAALISGEKTLTLSGNYHEMNWITRPDEFKVEKSSTATPILAPSDGQVVINGLNYDITATRTNESAQMQNIGEDYVTTFTYTDILTLPEGIQWREGLLEAVELGNWKLAGTKIIVSIDDGTGTTEDYDLVECTLSNSTNLSIQELGISVNENDILEIYWTVENTKTTDSGEPAETDIPIIKLTVGDEVLIADLDKLILGETADVSNHVSMTPHYTYQQTSETTESSVDVSVYLSAGDVVLTKTHDRTSGIMYWGEDINYTVTVSNESVLTASGYSVLEDSLNRYQYIKASNMQKMFEADADKKMSIQITLATLYNLPEEKKNVVAVDGKTSVTVTAQDTGYGVENYYSGLYEKLDEANMLSNGTATITFYWDDDGVLIMKVEDSQNESLNTSYTIGEERNYGTIEDAINGIGYAVTEQVNSQYIITWDLTDVELAPGEVLEYEIPATVQDSFMLLTLDMVGENYLTTDSRFCQNTVNLKNTSGRTVKEMTAGKIAYREIMLGKSGSSDGDPLNDNFDIKDGSVIDYTLSFAHSGKGSYDTLPLVDHMSGANVLIAKVSDNSNAEWVKDLPTKEIDGESYYILNAERTYEKVKLGDYWASDVVVKKSSNGLDTIIHWYFTNTPKRAYSMEVSYQTLVSRDYAGITSASFEVLNETWLNDHQSHRLYAALNGDGSIISGNKYIVSPEGEMVRHTELEKDLPNVTYALLLKNEGSTSATISGADIYDALPQTYTSDVNPTFAWEKNVNVFLSYSENAEVVNPDRWNIAEQSPANGTTAAGQYYISWDDDFNATISANETLTITVKLTFPMGEAWDKYAAACNGQLLYNNFYIYHMSAQVSHGLKGINSAKLQKGVYEVGTMSYKANATSHRHKPYISTGTRHLYGNLSARAYIVTYYVTLYNDGTNRLYLNPIMDSLPEGFRLHSMVISSQGIGPYSSMEYVVGHSEKCTTEVWGNPAKQALSSISDEDVNYLSTNVTGTVIGKDGENYTLSFTFAGGDLDDGFHYDSERDLYYLLPGEAIRFGYSCDTNLEKYTKDTAVNTIMMPFTDYTSGGLTISDAIVKASDENGLNPNDGDCKVITDAQAADFGFVREDGDSNDQWLSSDVTVTRGTILPGIRKTASAPNAEVSKPVEWEITAYNDGDFPLNNYVITDEIESPYKFEGEIFYEVYTSDGFANGDKTSTDYKPAVIGGTSQDMPLFTIVSNEMNTEGVETITIKDNNGDVHTLNEGNNYSVTLKCNSAVWYADKYETNVKQSSVDYRMSITVSFAINDEGNQELSIRFLTYRNTFCFWGIPAGGYGKLTLSTINNSGTYFNKVFNNNAWITPIGENRDFDQNPIHGNLTALEIDGTEYPSVSTNAIVNVSSGIFTTSEKRVTEIKGEDKSNVATSTSEINYILLQDKTSTFRYDLEVTTPVKHTMSKFVLIDNLPQAGDYTSFGTAVERKSEFDVSLAPTPDIIVTIKTGDEEAVTLDSSQYTIEYSTKTVSSAENESGVVTKTTFSEEDWAGTSSAEWSADLDDFWDKENEIMTARSLRLVINDPDAAVLKANSVITLSFNAVIKDPEAAPGQTAWNSFGYHYEVPSGGNEPLVLEAAPLKVGIRFPSVPRLVKHLQDSNGNAYAAEQDETFSFLIYKGNLIQDLEDVPMSDIPALLAEKGITQYFVQDMQIKAGESSSDTVTLRPSKWYAYGENGWTETSSAWIWEDDARYTAIELPIDSIEYEFGTINNMTSQSYTFTYNAESVQSITAMNKYRTWDLILTKVDKEDSSNLLADAVFAIYSPEKLDADLYSSETADSEIAALKKNHGVLIDIPKTISYPPDSGTEVTTYYLKSIAKTGSTGVCSWSNLMEEGYVLLELRAPNGYNLDTSLRYVSREEDYHVEKTITNEGGYELPESGGIGTDALLCSGITIALTATAGISICNHTEVPEPKKKSKGKDGKQS